VGHVQQARYARWQRSAITAAGGGCESLLELTLYLAEFSYQLLIMASLTYRISFSVIQEAAMAVRVDVGPSPSAHARAGQYAISGRMELVTGI